MPTRTLLGLIPVLMLCGPMWAADEANSFDGAMKRATVEYTERLRTAADELNRVRADIAAEKAPHLEALRVAENRVIAAQVQTGRLETGSARAEQDKRALLKEIDGLRKNISYITTLGHDGLKALSGGLAPGEEQLIGEKLQALERELEKNTEGPNGPAAVAVAELLLARTQRALGGYTAPASAAIAETNVVLEGTLAFVGPETFFRPEQGGAGVVRRREGSRYPISHTLPLWKAEDADAFFSGRAGAMPADASNGKALRLQQTSGTVFEHVRKGGVVAYAILLVGAAALLLIAGKFRDVARMKVDSREAVQPFLRKVAHRQAAEAQVALSSLRP
ncbi:MAG TPA: hypothetical protein VEQ65_10820, partial [Opitutus sp.]|nr:hypothetical protein [Opitutus sp.]